MPSYRILSVIKRELREKLMSKSFIFMTILMPAIMLIIMGFQALMVLYQGDKGTKIEVVTESAILTEECRKVFSELEFIKEGSWTITYNTVPLKEIKGYVDSKKSELLKELTGIIFIPDKALIDKNVEYYANIPNKLSVFEKMNGPVNNVLIDQYFKEKTLSPEELNFVRRSVKFNNFKVSKEDKIEEQGIGNMIFSFVFAFLLYLSLIMTGTMTMSSVMEEKTSKVVEVLLSSVSSKELMAGKIIGSTITALVQMIIWLSPMIILIATSWITLPVKFKFDIGLGYLVYFLFNFSIGMLIFQGLFAMVGAIFNDPQEAQQGVFPVIFLIMIPFFITFSMLRNPDNQLAVVASYFPFATIIVMPCRYTLVDMSFIYPLISCLINIATLAIIIPVAGKVYRVGILRTGTKPGLKEVMRWVKAKG
ncbi:MAG: ABC transporter permease [Deltaproteobacteria bacterium]|nr:ABC transporter permease [Deltaproteobacteria bacterium]